MDQSSTETVHVRIKGGSLESAPTITIRTDLNGGRFVPQKGATIVFDHVNVENVDFSKANFDHFVSLGSRFIGCDFSGTKYAATCGLGDGNLLSECTFKGADLRGWWPLGDTRFERCHFVGSRIEGWKSWCAEFIECVFACRIRNSIFAGVPDNSWTPVGRPFNEFRDNDFSLADMDFPDFRSIDLRRQRWPASAEYRIWDRWTERLLYARQAVQGWPRSKEQARALHMLNAYLASATFVDEEITGPMTIGHLGPELRVRIESLLAACPS